MKDFTYYAPTEVVFGRDAESHIGRLVRKYGGHKVLVHYGGGSVVRSGLLDAVCAQLGGAPGLPGTPGASSPGPSSPAAAGGGFLLLGGVVPNPRLGLVHEGIELCRREGVDMILAVGGGSVMDSAKAIAYGVPYDGDVWDFFCGKARPETALPVGCVVTNPASGSEMSDSCVITNEALMDKRGFSSPLGRCRFAVSNPERTFTLSPYQTAAGVADIMMHTMERYFSNDMDMTLTESLAEALLRTLKESAYKVLEAPCDYQARAQIMWGGSLSHNGLTECGMQRDWACHKMEHELSGMFDVTHGAGLTALWPTWARYVYKTNVPRFARFALRVMGAGAGPVALGLAVPGAAIAPGPAGGGALAAGALVPAAASAGGALASGTAGGGVWAGSALASGAASASDALAGASECPQAAVGLAQAASTAYAALAAGALVPGAASVAAALAGAPDAAEALALEGIAAMERFYRDIGMPVTLRELLGRPATDDEIVEMARRCSHDGAITVGALRVLSRADIEAIYRAAN